MNCGFKSKVRDSYICPNPAVENRFGGLCVFHLFSISAKFPETAYWGISSLLNGQWPKRISEEFSRLLERNEADCKIEVHDFTGFWFPSL